MIKITRNTIKKLYYQSVTTLSILDKLRIIIVLKSHCFSIHWFTYKD
jgi:hypothetical protein